MKTIYKYEIALSEGTVEVPENHEVLHIGEQNGRLFMWVLVGDSYFVKIISSLVIGTGWPVEGVSGKGYFGTVQMASGLVWHVFLSGANRKT